MCVPGLLTNSKREIQFSVPLPKNFNSSAQEIDINELRINVRTNGEYFVLNEYTKKGVEWNPQIQIWGDEIPNYGEYKITSKIDRARNITFRISRFENSEDQTFGGDNNYPASVFINYLSFVVANLYS